MARGWELRAVVRNDSRKKEFLLEAPFDVLRQSDFDVAISSRQLFDRAKALQIPTRGRIIRTQPQSIFDLNDLGLQELPTNLRQKVV